MTLRSSGEVHRWTSPFPCLGAPVDVERSLAELAFGELLQACGVIVSPWDTCWTRVQDLLHPLRCLVQQQQATRVVVVHVSNPSMPSPLGIDRGPDMCVDQHSSPCRLTVAGPASDRHFLPHLRLPTERQGGPADHTLLNRLQQLAFELLTGEPC